MNEPKPNKPSMEKGLGENLTEQTQMRKPYPTGNASPARISAN